MIQGVSEPWDPIRKKRGGIVGWYYDDTHVDVSPLDRSHQVRQIVCQEIAPSGDLQFHAHADFSAIVKGAFRPVDAARLDLSPPRRRCKSRIQHPPYGGTGILLTLLKEQKIKLGN